jgi:hypothetical protein
MMPSSTTAAESTTKAGWGVPVPFLPLAVVVQRRLGLQSLHCHWQWHWHWQPGTSLDLMVSMVYSSRSSYGTLGKAAGAAVGAGAGAPPAVGAPLAVAPAAA